MKVLKYIFSMMLLGGIISACADLDTKLTNEWSESDTWRDADMAQGVLLSVYQDVMIAPDAGGQICKFSQLSQFTQNTFPVTPKFFLAHFTCTA